MSQDAIRTKYEDIQPNAKTILYEGELSIDHDGFVSSHAGRILLTLRTAPQVTFEFDFPFSGGRDALKIEDEITIELPQSGGKGLGEIWGRRFESGPRASQIFTGNFKGPFQIGDFAASEIIQFHIPNFPSFVGSPFTRDGSITASRMSVDTGEWNIDLEEMNGYNKSQQVLNEEGGFAITHVGQLRRSNGKAISHKEAQRLTEILHWWLSFIRGERTGPILIAGIHRGDTIWEDSQAPTVHSWLDDRSWLPTRTPIDDSIAGPSSLGALFQYIFQLKEDDRGFNAFIRAIDWYTQSVHERHIAAMIVLAQAGIELMSWLSLVHDGGISEDGFDKWTASDQLRMALCLAKIDRDVPHTAVHLKRVAAKTKIYGNLDGPGCITEIRNAVIHPKKKERFDDFAVMLQGAILATHYLELLILHRSGYRGLIMNRGDYSAGPAIVPWAKEQVERVERDSPMK